MRPTAAQTAGAAPLPGLLLLAGRPGFPGARLFTGRSLWTQVVTYARCAKDGLDPAEWFPVSAESAIGIPERGRVSTRSNQPFVRARFILGLWRTAWLPFWSGDGTVPGGYFAGGPLPAWVGSVVRSPGSVPGGSGR
jgi:hypothetical protein